MLTQLREQLVTFWEKQSKSQRIVLVILLATALILAPLFIAWANTPSYAVAFSGLSESDAGTIVEKLDEDSTPYQIRNGGTILVPADKVYDVRLKMARQGLPQGGTVGFELFSGNTLGMTEFTQRVNYQQAMEGELERTISSLAAVDAVRVHIVTPEKTLLSSDQAPATASITVKESPGNGIDAAQVRSITHLVASAVEGLKPENVVVVDVNGNMLASGGSGDSAAVLAQSDEHRSAEFMVAKELQTKVQDILDTALGPNKSVVQASVTMDWTERESTTQSYDPDTVVIRSLQNVREVYTTTNGTLSGVPGATSNLPPADTGTGADNQALNYLRDEEITNYEITQKELHEVEAPGTLKRISLSVLVDGVTDQAQLDSLETVIAAAAGIDTSRGDLLAVETLEFDRTFYENQATEFEKDARFDLYMKIGSAVVGGLVLVALLWYIQRLLSNLKLASEDAWTPVMRPLGETLSGGGLQPQLQPAAAYSTGQPKTQPGAAEPEPVKPPPVSLPKFEIPEVSPEDEQLQNLIQELADEDPSALASIIQLWVTEDEQASS